MLANLPVDCRIATKSQPGFETLADWNSERYAELMVKLRDEATCEGTVLVHLDVLSLSRAAKGVASETLRVCRKEFEHN